VLLNDNVSMSVGHLDHVLIVYSLMEHVTWKSPGPMCGWVGRILHPDSCTILGTQERSGHFHSWYTDPSLQGKGEQCNSQVKPSQTMPWKRTMSSTGTRQKWSTERHSDRPDGYIRGTLDQEDTDVHESGCRILPTQPHMGPGDFQVTCSIKL